ncbi:MAG: ribosomal protein S18-alanine N-acetyltransferase [Lachnospiraceae bacterium]|nr:ribosomal protein S18-alanine N-acetyltransferase [Lachnospiraceae bacterium]
MEIRRMTFDDLPQVYEIEKEIFSKPWSYKAFKDALDLSNAVYLVCASKEEILGYCGLYCVLDEGTITNMAVREEFRNKGIGYMLLQNIIDEAKKIGITKMTLEVRKSNLAAFHLYKQVGFEASGIRKNFYSAPPEDAIIMWKYDM